jgi:predicted restriction endonuclease
VDKLFHVRFIRASRLSKLHAAVIPEGILSKPKGIRLAPSGLLAALNVPAQTVLDAFKEEAEQHSSQVFDPKDITDGRRRIMNIIIQRQGQQAFRRKVLSAYETKCAVTGCTTMWVLEAAHITPYLGVKTNAVSNGMLLRADVHTLFDLALISIEPRRMKIRVSGQLAKSPYGLFEGKAPDLPRKTLARPSMAALEEHFSQFQP